MDKKRVFGELELAIVKIFQTHSKLTVREVLGLLRAEDKYTTIMTVMNRMVEKKILMRQRIGLQYEYWLVKETSLLDQLKNKFFGGNSASILTYLLEECEELSPEELEAMEQRIKELKMRRS
jgi:predicted transcriptional regulator